MEEKVIAGCGIEIRKDEGWVCPHLCRKGELDKISKGSGPCQVDLQLGTNVCLYAPDEFFKNQKFN